MRRILKNRWARTGLLAAALWAMPAAAQDGEEEDGGGFLENLIEDRLSGPGFSVDVRGFQGALSSRATVAAIVISDDEGPWLTVRDAVLDWNRSALLRGRLEVEELSAAAVELPRLPQADDSVDVPSPEAQPFSLPDLPVSVMLDQFRVERVDLGQPILGTPAVIALQGSAQLAGGAGQVDIEAERIDDRTGRFDIEGSYDNDDGQLSLNLALEEGPGGIAVGLIGIPGEPALDASIEGSGPVSDFTANVALATDGEPRLDGTVTLLGEDGANRFAVDLGGDLTELFSPSYRPFFGPDVQLAAQGSRTAEGAINVDTFELSAQSLDLRGQVAIGADGVPDLIDVTGEISSGEGPVLLPLGSDIRVGRVGLDVQFDASAGEDWTGGIVIDDLDQPGARISRVALDGSGVIAGAGETLDVAANFDFAAEGLALDDGGLEQALGEAVTGRAEIAYAAGGPVRLDQITLNGAGFALDGNGQVDPDGDQLPVAFRARLDADDLAVFSALAGRPLNGGLSADLDLTATVLDGGFDVSLDGRARDLAVGVPQIDPLLAGDAVLDLAAVRDGAGLRIDTLTLRNDALDLTGSADLTSDGGTAEVEMRVDDLGRIDPDLTGPGTLNFTANNPGDAWTVDLTAAGAEADVDGTAVISDLDADSPLADLDLSVEAADLANFSVFAGRELGGAIDVTVDGTARLDGSVVDADLAGTLQDVTIDQPEADRLMRGTTAMSAQIRKAGSRITVPELSIENPQITVDGNARVADGDSAVVADIVIADLAEVVPSMSGRAELSLDATEDATGWTGALTGSGAGAEISANGSLTELDAATSPLARGSLSLRAPDLAAFSELARRELGGSVELTAEGQARLDLSQAEGRIDGTTQDLELGQPELNRLMAGTTELSVQASKDGAVIVVPELSLANPQVSVAADGRYGTADSAVRAQIDFPDLSSIVPDMSGPGTVDLLAEQQGDVWQVLLDGDGAGVMLSAMADVTDLQTAASPGISGEMTLEAADLSRFSTIVDRPLAGSVSLSASGDARIDGSSFDVEASGEANGLRTGAAEADQLLAGTTTFDAAASREGAEAPIRVERFELDAPGLDATAQGSLLGGQSDLTFQARLADLGAFVGGLNGPVTAEGRAGQAQSAFTLDVDVTGPEGITARVSGEVAESFDTADLDVNGSAPLRLANPFIQPRNLNGLARFDLAVDGPLQLTSVTGQVTVEGGRLIDPGLPLVLNDVSATARLQGGSVELDVTAAKEDGGTLRVSGPVSLQPGYAADLGVTLDNVVFEDPRLYRTELDGTLGIDGPLTGGARISGDIVLDETELRIPSTGLGATGPIPDGLVHVNEPADVRATRERAGLIEDPGAAQAGGGGGAAFPLDVTILAQNRIFIRGRGLDAELGGRLTLQGTTANVIPSGQFELIRGRLDLLGQRIELTEGVVSLEGDFTPFVRLVARTDAGDVTVIVVVEGPALTPEISFLSEPELPEDEVLARLLFGRSIDEISPLQAAQLASAVATLAGRGGDGIIANLRKGAGLDDLDVTTDEEGNVGLRAGKYLSENLYTDVTVDAAGEAEINLNLDVTDSVTVRGSAANTGETGLGIFYERDY